MLRYLNAIWIPDYMVYTTLHYLLDDTYRHPKYMGLSLKAREVDLSNYLHPNHINEQIQEK